MTPTPKKVPLTGWSAVLVDTLQKSGMSTVILLALAIGAWRALPTVYGWGESLVESTVKTQEAMVETQSQIADSVKRIDESTKSIMEVEDQTIEYMELAQERHDQCGEEHKVMMQDHVTQLEKLNTIETNN